VYEFLHRNSVWLLLGVLVAGLLFNAGVEKVKATRRRRDRNAENQGLERAASASVEAP